MSLSPVETEIVKYKADGILSQEEIGKRLKLHRNIVGKALQRPAVREAIEELRIASADSLPRNLDDAIDAVTPIAIAALVEVSAHGRSERARVEADKYLLERAYEASIYRM